ncbi:MAG: T9SS type A sorting domain-containing protein [Bacteroidia bacterium]
MKNLEESKPDDGGKVANAGQDERSVIAEPETVQQVKPLSTIFHQNLIVECPEQGAYSISIFDMHGRRMLEFDRYLEAGKNSLDLGQLSEGAYIIRLLGQDGNTVSARVLKQ